MRHCVLMSIPDAPVAIHQTMFETLAVDAMVLADEVETYFEGATFDDEMRRLPSGSQAALARVALKIGKRLAACVEWLIRREGPDAPRVPGEEGMWSAEDELALPPRARALAEAARAVLARVAQLGDIAGPLPPVASPARALQQELRERLLQTVSH